MTLILRSDSAAINHLGGRHGFTGPTDYVAMLDFSAGDYFKIDGGNRVDIPLSGAISVARTSEGVVQRRDMSLYTVPANTPRLSYNSSKGVSGLLLEDPRTNLLTSGANGTALTIPNGSGFVILSYAGGSAEITGTGLTYQQTWESGGRTCKRYSRDSGVISATLTTSGGASDIQVELAVTNSGYYASLFMGYGGSKARDIATLGPDVVPLLTSGSFSIIMQVVMNDAPLTAINSSEVIRVVSGSPYGGVLLKTVRSSGASGSNTDTVHALADGSTTSATALRSTLNGSYRESTVFGVTCQNFGDDLGIISYGQYAKTVGAGVKFGAPAAAYIGGGPIGRAIGGLVTRVAIYDRMLSDTEAWRSATAWT